MKKWLAILLALVLLCCAFGAIAEEPVTLELSRDAVYVAVSKADVVKATFSSRDVQRAGVTFAMSDESIATVDSYGKVKGVAIGETTLTVTSKQDASLTATIPVYVVLQVKKVNAENVEMHIGESAKIQPVYVPSDATFTQAVYESSDEDIAVVAADGTVTGVSRGRCNVTVTSLDGYAKTKVRVIVDQKAEAIDLSEEEVALPLGRKAQVKASVLPKEAANKSVSWSSADESIATVDAKGRITITSKGETVVTATSDDDPSITASLNVQGIELATAVAFDSKSYDVLVNQTTQLYVTVSPDEASIKNVTYKVKNPKIATVDENGVVTGLKGGKTTVYAYTTDGSKKRAQTTLTVIVPVTGVSYKTPGLRVGSGSKGTFTATIEPESATNKNMTWTSSDEGIATVSGKTNRFSVKGRAWGRCSVTGVTEDGSYAVSVDVNVGSLRHAVTVVSVAIRNGKPYLVLKNRSNMNITQVRYQMRGTDSQFKPVQMSTRNNDTLYGTYDEVLLPGEKTHHGHFDFYHPSSYPDLRILQFTITGWTTDTGYYDNNGNLKYDYDVPQKSWEWVSSPTDGLL